MSNICKVSSGNRATVILDTVEHILQSYLFATLNGFNEIEEPFNEGLLQMDFTTDRFNKKSMTFTGKRIHYSKRSIVGILNLLGFTTEKIPQYRS